jgi:GNAT superfamily N-acetyltransferase
VIALRRARATDAGAVGAILSEFVDTTDWMPRIHTRAEDLAHAGALIARGWVTVAELEGAVAGFVAQDGKDLDALYVSAAMRGQGIGSQLLNHIKSGCEVIELWTFQANRLAQSFYLKHGFIELRRTDGADNDERLPDIRYQWKREAA